MDPYRRPEDEPPILDYRTPQPPARGNFALELLLGLVAIVLFWFSVRYLMLLSKDHGQVAPLAGIAVLTSGICIFGGWRVSRIHSRGFLAGVLIGLALGGLLFVITCANQFSRALAH